ncbi:MAG: hypothetical protein ACREQF_03160, partial [Candidatus Binataceae bacterium]
VRAKQGFATKYRIDRLILVEQTDNPTDAISREKQIKGWTRAKKIALVRSVNPQFRDLSEGWFGDKQLAVTPPMLANGARGAAPGRNRSMKRVRDACGQLSRCASFLPALPIFLSA